MSRSSDKLVILVAIAALTACAPSTVATPNPDPLNVIYFKGRIDNNLLNALGNAKPHPVLVITSHGGGETFGIKAGEEIHAKGLRVVVKGYCLSACANYVALAGRTLTIEPNSVLGFHGTNFNNGLNSASKDERRRRFEELFASANVDPSLVFCAEDVLFTGEFVSRDHTFSDGVTRRIRHPVLGEKKLWIPSIELMRRYGLNVDGGQPRSALEAAKILSGSTKLTPDEIEMDGSDLAACAAT